jgi:c-di-GMP-related signal transduction protein
VAVEICRSVFVARQPIFDASRRVFGYELLYRHSSDATACAAEGDLATARVLTDALLTLGLDALTGGRHAFVNFTHSVLLDGAADVLPRERVVIELREDIAVDADVIRVCRDLRDAGRALALDDFVPESDAERLLPYVQYVKVDVLDIRPDEQIALADRLRSSGVRLVAEKVETADAFALSAAAGYSLFQGHFFSRPDTVGAATISASHLTYLQLLAALGRPGLTVRELEELVKRDLSLTYRVLQCVNAAGTAVRREVVSIHQALVLMGFDPIRRWAALWCLAGLDRGSAGDLVTMSLLRGRCCELLAQDLGQPDSAAQMFIVGLCSLLDAILGRPMAELVPKLPLTHEARHALLGSSSWIRTVLDGVIAYEQGAWNDAFTTLQPVGASVTDVSVAYARAL